MSTFTNGALYSATANWGTMRVRCLDADLAQFRVESCDGDCQPFGDITGWMIHLSEEVQRTMTFIDERPPAVFGEPSDEEFEPRDYNDADGVETMGDHK